MPHGHYQATTIIATVRLKGARAPWLFGGALDGELFLAWVKQELVTCLQRDDVVIMDNLATHKVAGARLEYLPPYSPDFNPIENLWNKVKAGVKNRAPHTARQLFRTAGEAFDPVTPRRLPRILFTRRRRYMIAGISPDGAVVAFSVTRRDDQTSASHPDQALNNFSIILPVVHQLVAPITGREGLHINAGLQLFQAAIIRETMFVTARFAATSEAL